MKKIFLLLLFVCSSLLSYADGLTATLQHGETMTAYFGPEALNSAYTAAANGDIITLSAGEFTGITSIAKSVRIIGAFGLTTEAGYCTFISTAMSIDADNVKLEGMSFKGDITLGNVENTIIRRCWILNLKQSGTHTHTLIDQCVLMDDAAIKTGVNYALKNTHVDHFSDTNTASNMANITNCHISRFYQSGQSYYRPFAVYKNNVLRLHHVSTSAISIPMQAPSEYYYNCIYLSKNSSSSSYYYCSYTFDSGCIVEGNGSNTYVGSDFPTPNKFAITVGGQKVGITGGEGWVTYPGIPRVTAATIDAYTDDKGKLNAEITVTAEK